MELIGRDAMRESPFYDELLTEGRLEARRADVKQAVEIRFGAAAASEVQTALEGISDLERLAELHEAAIRCRRISEFRKELSKDLARR
jgi:hypothetical protein